MSVGDCDHCETSLTCFDTLYELYSCFYLFSSIRHIELAVLSLAGLSDLPTLWKLLTSGRESQAKASAHHQPPRYSNLACLVCIHPA